MTFSTDKQLQSSERFVLARLNPARFINDDLVLISASTYSATFESIKNISVLKRNGAGLTEVTTITGDDEYTFDEQTGVLTVQLADAPNEDTNILVLFHHLYLTTHKGRYFGSDPLLAVSESNPERLWEARIARTPAIEESYKNIINAVMTVKASSLSINNADQFLNPFLTLQDSFKNKTIELYIGINSSLEKLFTGPMNDVSIRDVTATIAFRDAFSKINNPADLGGDHEDIFYTRSQYSSIDPKQEEQLKVTAFGIGTPSRNIPQTSARSGIALVDIDKKVADVRFYNQGVNIDYASGTASSVNRDFHLFRSSTALGTQTLGTLVRQTTKDIRGSETVHFYNFSDNNLRVGQTFKWDDGGGPYYAIVHHVGDFTDGGFDYNVMVGKNGTLDLNDPIMTDVNDFDPLNTLIVNRHILSGGTTSNDSTYSIIFLREEVDYTLSQVIAPLPLGTNVEITLDSSISFDSNTDAIYWSADYADFGLGGVVGHATATERLLKSAGIDTNSASFDAAQTALNLNIRMQIPKFGDTTLPTYRDVIEDIAGSALTFLFQNEDGEAEYGILESPVAGNIRDDSLIISGSQSARYNYNDIIQSIDYFNRHQVTNIFQDDITKNVLDNKSIQLHGESILIEFDHVLDDISTRIGDILDMRSSRQSEYSYSVATEDIDTELGEDITLESAKITPTGTKNVKIISIKRSADRVQVKATDLGELS